jgi:hypothetical protein
VQVKVRFSTEEHAQLLGQAQRANKKPTVFIRALVAGSRMKPVAVYPPEVMRAIVGLGRNWNQLVRKVHSTSALDREDTRAMLQEIRDIWLALVSRSTSDDLPPQ